MNKLLYLLLIAVCFSCANNAITEKYQSKRDQVINVRENIKEIEIKDILISNVSWPYLISDYLLIRDYNSHDKLISLFDKNNFSYITGITNRGKGPGEIANIGHIAADEARHKFYVTDVGKQRIFSYDLDSVLANPLYMPKVKMETNLKQFPIEYLYVNDTLCIGSMIEPVGNSDFKVSVAKWNMNTGEITPMKYTHPDIEKKRTSFAASVEHGIYVECYHHHDLMTICNFNGDLKYNIYSNKWDSKKTNKVRYYGDAAFCDDKIIVLYFSGENRLTDEMRVNYPTKFLVFDISGDYIKTLETGYSIVNFCYDKENNRLIMHLDDEIQFAYLELDGLIE